MKALEVRVATSDHPCFFCLFFMFYVSACFFAGFWILKIDIPKSRNDTIELCQRGILWCASTLLRLECCLSWMKDYKSDMPFKESNHWERLEIWFLGFASVAISWRKAFLHKSTKTTTVLLKAPRFLTRTASTSRSQDIPLEQPWQLPLGFVDSWVVWTGIIIAKSM